MVERKGDKELKKAFENICDLIERRKAVSILLLFICALLIRLLFFNLLSDDYVLYLQKWSNYILQHDGISSWKYPFHNYQMPYIYLFTFFCYLPLKNLFAVKLLSVIFDFIAAFVVYKTVKIKYKNSFAVPFLGAAVFLFTPTVILNSAWWAQCDVIYTTFLLLSGYYCLKEKSLLCLLFFGIAFSFKAQAVFFAPVLLIFWYRKKFNLLYFLIIPAVYILSILPAFGVGRNFIALLSCYLHQSFSLVRLSMNAPNFYILLPNAYYHIIAPLGMLLAVCLVCLVIYLIIKQNKNISTEQWIEIMLLFLLLIPFVLPKMHERFFFPANVFAVLYLFFRWERRYVYVLITVVSLIMYLRYLLYPCLPNGVYAAMALVSLLLNTWAVWKVLDLKGRFGCLRKPEV